jgi:hypothetical protein
VRSDSGLSHGHSQSRWGSKSDTNVPPRGTSLGDSVEFVYVTVSQSRADRDLANLPKGTSSGSDKEMV